MALKYKQMNQFNYRSFFKGVQVGDICTYDFYNFLLGDVKRYAAKEGVKIQYITHEIYGNLRKEVGDCGFEVLTAPDSEPINLEQNNKQELIFNPEELVV